MITGKDYIEQLNSFETIGLADVQDSLAQRTDTKFLFSEAQLNEILIELRNHYRVLEINGLRISAYATKYFDTAGLKFYKDHHRGIARRRKVRIRSYPESNTAFLEVKEKKRPGLTKKYRLKRKVMNDPLSSKEVDFIEKTSKHSELSPSLMNNFSRITFLHKERYERLTLDVGLNFHLNGTNKSFDGLVIAEIKQEKQDRSSAFFQAARKIGAHQRSVSKYCLGISSLYPEIKSNRFKKKHHIIHKILSHESS